MSSVIQGTTTEIKVQPIGFSSVYNENIVVLESPNIISDNFKWLIDIYINGLPTDSGSSYISSLQILPNPDGFGVIDTHRIIENYISSTFFPADNDNTGLAVDSFTTWSLDIRESFDNARWRFEDNFFTGNLGFTSTTNKHPFVVGDVINVVQDPGFTYPSYNGVATITSVIDEYNIEVDKPWISPTGTEGGIASLVDTSNRTINIEQSDTRTPYIAFNGVFNNDELFDFDWTEYNLSFGSTKKFLTNLPRTYNVRRTDHIWTNFFSFVPNNHSLLITTNNGVFSLTVPLATAGQNFNYFKQVKIGPADLLNPDRVFTVQSGALPVLDENSTFIEAEIILTAGLVTISETIRLDIVDECSKFENYQFFFLDRFGSYVPVNFDLVSKKKISNDKTTWNKHYGQYDSVSNVWGYTKYDRGISTLDIKTNESITVTSNWLTEEQNELVQIMLTSPEVYHVDTNGVFRGINITTTSYDIKTKLNDKLVNYVISFEYAQKNKNQRG